MPNAQCQNSGLVPGPVSMPLMGKEGYGFSVTIFAPTHCITLQSNGTCSRPFLASLLVSRLG